VPPGRVGFHLRFIFPARIKAAPSAFLRGIGHASSTFRISCSANGRVAGCSFTMSASFWNFGKSGPSNAAIAASAIMLVSMRALSHMLVSMSMSYFDTCI
jgi:hypothetical protein